MNTSRKRITKVKQKKSKFPGQDVSEKMTNPNQFEQLHQQSESTYDGTNIKSGNQFVTSNIGIRILFKLSLFLSFGWWAVLDLFLALFISTTDLNNDGAIKIISILCTCFKGFLFVLLLLFLLPFALLGFLIWLPLQLIRPRSFSLFVNSHTDKEAEKYYLLDNNSTSYKNIINSYDDDTVNLNLPVLQEPKIKNDRAFCVLTCNVCLMPEFLSRINNLSNVNLRSKKIAQAVVNANDNHNAKIRPNKISSGFQIAMENEMLVPIKSGSSTDLKNSQHDFEIFELDSAEQASETQSIASAQWSVTSKELAVSDNLPPNIDFICLQEVFDTSATKILLQKLAKRYNHIIYDVSWPIHDKRFSLINSGLCIASKYPFMDVKFKAFPRGFREDQFACKGLLMTKVFVGEVKRNHYYVGYIATTHLQAITHPQASRVRCQEINSILQWLEEFKSKNSSSPSSSEIRETVLFDVVCGDFNFDMESHCEENERNCDFRNIYRDPCMNELSGQQHSWVVGTSLIEKMLHDSAVSSPNMLQRMMVSELERPKFVYSTKPSALPSSTCTDGRRRIDYILYKPCKEKTLVMKDYKFHTTLAGLTDHIPVSMTFSSCD